MQRTGRARERFQHGPVPWKASVGKDGIVLPGNRIRSDEPLDVLLDGYRVWSFRPHEYSRGRWGQWWIPWPEPLRARLVGFADVAVQRSVDGTLVIEPTRIAWGPRPLALVNGAGDRMALDKWGRLVTPFETTKPEFRRSVASSIQSVVEQVSLASGRAAFIVSGTLLGAVRDGLLLPHDDDGDIGYLSAHTNPVDVAREQLALGRALEASGMHVIRHSFGHLQVHYEHEGSVSHYVDVFTCFYVGDWFHQPFHVRAKVPPSSLLPLGTIELEGLVLPSPQDPAPLLEANYGPQWRVPDPAFRLETPRSTRCRFSAWLGDMLGALERWEAEYRSDDEVGDPGTAADSTAVAWMTHDGVSVDLGCGRGNEAAAAAGRGVTMVGVDGSASVIEANRRRAEKRGLDIDYVCVNLNDPSDVLRLGRRLTDGGRHSPGLRIVARDLLHEMPTTALANVGDLFMLAMRPGDRALCVWPMEPVHAGETHLTPTELLRRWPATGLEVLEPSRISAADGRERWRVEVVRT